jgi:hypothetical protein
VVYVSTLGGQKQGKSFWRSEEKGTFAFHAANSFIP